MPISHSSKILLLIILNRLSAQLEPYLSEEQAGFRPNRSTIQQILTLRLVAEKAREINQPVHNCFIDFKKAFDSVWHKGLWAVLKSYGICHKILAPASADFMIKQSHQCWLMEVSLQLMVSNDSGQ